MTLVFWGTREGGEALAGALLRTDEVWVPGFTDCGWAVTKWRKVSREDSDGVRHGIEVTLEIAP